ncbi:molybdopterin cofactor-binding domain-containing protein [Brucella anthropi]|uniref:molybdopterin cofactor-binding domain-containing protein n=1 Tax=Brucella anthropi TaxID=529 RepID=UPI00178C4B0C|nr:molybdopterin cofactor-binding domain-containing protein [Brucella anthropi]
MSIVLPACGRAQTQPSLGSRFNDRIEVHADGTVHVLVGRIEMGQGLNSAITQLAAEELDVAMTRIVIPPVDTAFAPNEGFTDSSASMRGTGTAVRQAAAEARAMLLAMAARRLGVETSELSVQDGTILGGGESLTYWQLVGPGNVPLSAIGHVSIKQPPDYRLLGRDVPRIDLPAKITGGTAFVQDLRMPDMLHARVVRPPSYSARLLSLDATEVSALPGIVQLVRNGSFLAVVTEREEQAIRAAETLRKAARWQESETLPGDEALFSYLRREAGMEDQPAARSDRHLCATYEVPYRMHGSIGPSCAVAQFLNGNLTVWSHAQGMYPLRSSLSGLVDLPASRIRCIHMEGAGCYGHNGADDAAADAALVAMAIPERPIRLQWMREDEHLWEPYGPAMVMQMSGAVDANGRITEWNSRIASPAHSSRPGGAARLLAARYVDPPIAPSFLDGFTQWAGGGNYNADPYYDIPARVESRFVRRGPLRSSALRSRGGSVCLNRFRVFSKWFFRLG